MKVHHECVFVVGRSVVNDRGPQRGWDCKNEHRPIMFARKSLAIQKGAERALLNLQAAASRVWTALGCTSIVESKQSNVAISEVNLKHKLMDAFIGCLRRFVGQGSGRLLASSRGKRGQMTA